MSELRIHGVTLVSDLATPVIHVVVPADRIREMAPASPIRAVVPASRIRVEVPQ